MGLKYLFLKYKGTPSREEHKPSFSILTTIKMNLLVEFTNPVNNGLHTFNLKNMNHELRVMNCEIQDTSYKLQNMRYELQANIWDSKYPLHRLMIVRYVTFAVEWLFGAESSPGKFNWIVVLTLKPTFYFSRCSVLLKWKKTLATG